MSDAPQQFNTHSWIGPFDGLQFLRLNNAVNTLLYFLCSILLFYFSIIFNIYLYLSYYSVNSRVGYSINSGGFCGKHCIGVEIAWLVEYKINNNNIIIIIIIIQIKRIIIAFIFAMFKKQSYHSNDHHPICCSTHHSVWTGPVLRWRRTSGTRAPGRRAAGSRGSRGPAVAHSALCRAPAAGGARTAPRSAGECPRDFWKKKSDVCSWQAGSIWGDLPPGSLSAGTGSGARREPQEDAGRPGREEAAARCRGTSCPQRLQVLQGSKAEPHEHSALCALSGEVLYKQSLLQTNTHSRTLKHMRLCTRTSSSLTPCLISLNTKSRGLVNGPLILCDWTTSVTNITFPSCFYLLIGLM